MTNNFLELKNAIEEIKKGLGLNINIEYDEAENYQELIKGYILLVHAQLEYYFEELARSIIVGSYNNFNQGLNIKKPLISMTSTSLVNFPFPDFFGDQKGKKPDERISDIYSRYRGIIENNHGITDRHLVKIFWPLGIDEEFFDSDLLTMLDSFSSKRGKIAHSDARNELFDFKTIQAEVVEIIKQIELFDVNIKHLV